MRLPRFSSHFRTSLGDSQPLASRVNQERTRQGPPRKKPCTLSAEIQSENLEIQRNPEIHSEIQKSNLKSRNPI